MECNESPTRRTHPNERNGDMHRMNFDQGTETTPSAPIAASTAPRWKRRSALLWCLLACLLLPAATARAQRVRPIPSPGVPPWEAQLFPKVEQHTRYEIIRAAAGGPSLRSQSDCSASGFVLPLDDVDLTETPRLSWRWRIHQGLQNENEQAKAGDDFAARVYVIFAYDPRRSSWLERAARRVATLLFGRDLPGEAINYVWASHVPVGEHWPNPFTDAARMVSLRTHSFTPDAASWHSETVDLLADRLALLGEPLPRVEAIAVMTDTDNSCSRASAEFADFRLLGGLADLPAASGKRAISESNDIARGQTMNPGGTLHVQ
jgi:hypothetical protein